MATPQGRVGNHLVSAALGNGTAPSGGGDKLQAVAVVNDTSGRNARASGRRAGPVTCAPSSNPGGDGHSIRV